VTSALIARMCVDHGPAASHLDFKSQFNGETAYVGTSVTTQRGYRETTERSPGSCASGRRHPPISYSLLSMVERTGTRRLLSGLTVVHKSTVHICMVRSPEPSISWEDIRRKIDPWRMPEQGPLTGLTP
jgi:hypothetical protein